MADSTASTSNSADLYRQKWDHMFQERAHFEWHCDFDQVSSLLEPYFSTALNKGENHAIVDVGCGSSSLCVEIFKHFASPSNKDRARFEKLLLTDVSPYIMDVLRERYKDDPVVMAGTEFHIVDCRHLDAIGLQEKSMCAVLEKGTIDAMDGEADKVAILRECLRVKTDGGIVISISFPAVARLQLLEEEVRSWSEQTGARLKLHVHVVGSGDPARGGMVVFVAVIGEEAVMEAAGYSPSELTTVVLERARKSGSIIQEEEEVLEEEIDVFGDV